MRAIGINTWVWESPLTDENLPSLAQRIGDMGFDAIELPLEYDGAFTAPTAAKALAAAKLQPFIVGAMAPGRDLVETESEAVEATQQYLKACVRMAADIGAPSVCGPFYSATGRVWRMDATARKAAYGQLRDNLEPVLELADELGVRIGVEPLNRYETSLINTVEQALEALGPLLGSSLGLVLDSYHLNIEERSTAGAIHAAAPHLVHVQVCGNDRGAPGADQTDWPAFLAALDTAGYTGPLNIESFTADNASIATAASIWRPLAPSQDQLATDGLAFLRSISQPQHVQPARRSPMAANPTLQPAAPAADPAGRAAAPSSAAARTLGVAVVGYSFMGKAHSNAWRNVNAFYPGAQVAQRVLVGRDADGVGEAAQQYGWEDSATDWRSVLERDDVQIVDICAPGYLHAELAVAALEAGKHVLVEKPLANSLDEAATMAAAANRARANGVQSMVGFNYRRLPALALARRMVAEGALGDIRQVKISYLQDWLSDAAAPMSWRLRAETAGSGALGDLASHAVDQVHYLLDERITSISGTLNTFVKERDGEQGREPVTVDDAAWATARTSSGTVASLEVSRFATGRKNSLSIEIFGSAGSLSFDLESLNELHYYDAAAPAGLAGFSRILVTEETHPYLSAWWPTGHILGWDSTFTSQAADFLQGIATGTAPQPSFDDGIAVQRVLAGLAESASQASTVVDIRH